MKITLYVIDEMRKLHEGGKKFLFGQKKNEKNLDWHMQK